jgi:hypothetical protein
MAVQMIGNFYELYIFVDTSVWTNLRLDCSR